MTQDPGAESKMSVSPILKYLPAGSYTMQKKRKLPILNAKEWQAWRGRLQVWEYLQKEKIEEGIAELGKYRGYEGAIENTNIWSSEKCGGASGLGKKHTEEEHGEKLISSKNG